jgi:hypothetical protein
VEEPVAVSPTEIPINAVVERLKARIAEDAVTIAMLQAALDQTQDVTPSGDSHAADAAPVG